ncbi:corepressor interacting with RBPJ 1-like [Stylophora pistillata]|uniref:corepressor interacting with RBPJ 1-like n=1 Tax=Stylophora pistillata TaxID=50429 RepID=UPI000C04864B|nr:corepressor interacting with RBPJ 1-like [Stylophora pistillata]
MFAKFMNKKDFHPGSKANIKRVWMAEQKLLASQQKEKELELQYNKEQERFKNRQAISNDERIKSGLDFLYDAPPGFNKDQKVSEEEEGEVKFEWQRGAPREAYAKSLGIEARDQPFGIAVRNVKCIKCGKWGHINTDRECPLFNKSKNANVDPSLITDIADPMRLLKDMQSDGLTLKQNVLGRVFDPSDPNQQIVASDDEGEDDTEAAFLASLTDKQKKKLLRKLDRLEREEMEAQSGHNKRKKKKEKKKRKRNSSSDSEEESNKQSKTGYHSESDSSDSGEGKIRKKSKNEEKRRNSRELAERDLGEKYRKRKDTETDRHHGDKHRRSRDAEKGIHNRGDTRGRLEDIKANRHSKESVTDQRKDHDSHRHSRDLKTDRRHSETGRHSRDNTTTRHSRDERS